MVSNLKYFIQSVKKVYIKKKNRASLKVHNSQYLRVLMTSEAV